MRYATYAGASDKWATQHGGYGGQMYSAVFSGTPVVSVQVSCIYACCHGNQPGECCWPQVYI
jgi:hypothetical protein